MPLYYFKLSSLSGITNSYVRIFSGIFITIYVWDEKKYIRTRVKRRKPQCIENYVTSVKVTSLIKAFRLGNPYVHICL